jgi:hypothetical protein
MTKIQAIAYLTQARNALEAFAGKARAFAAAKFGLERVGAMVSSNMVDLEQPDDIVKANLQTIAFDQASMPAMQPLSDLREPVRALGGPGRVRGDA